MRCHSNFLAFDVSAAQARGMTKPSPPRYFNTRAEIIRTAVMKDSRFPLSLRNVEDLLTNAGAMPESW